MPNGGLSLWALSLSCPFGLPSFVGRCTRSRRSIRRQSTHGIWHVGKRIGAITNAASKRDGNENQKQPDECHLFGLARIRISQKECPDQTVRNAIAMYHDSAVAREYSPGTSYDCPPPGMLRWRSYLNEQCAWTRDLKEVGSRHAPTKALGLRESRSNFA